MNESLSLSCRLLFLLLRDHPDDRLPPTSGKASMSRVVQFPIRPQLVNTRRDGLVPTAHQVLDFIARKTFREEDDRFHHPVPKGPCRDRPPRAETGSPHSPPPPL